MPVEGRLYATNGTTVGARVEAGVQPSARGHQLADQAGVARLGQAGVECGIGEGFQGRLERRCVPVVVIEIALFGAGTVEAGGQGHHAGGHVVRSREEQRGAFLTRQDRVKAQGGQVMSKFSTGEHLEVRRLPGRGQCVAGVI